MSAPEACCRSATTPRSTADRPELLSTCGRIIPRRIIFLDIYLWPGGAEPEVCGTLRRMTDTTLFPDGFLFGAAVSAHQVEGGNTNNDWWWWEHLEATPCREPSGDACDFYHRYREDIALLAGLGLNAFRFSLEWARIEPAEGEFSNAALGPYRRVLEACREHGV